MPQGMFLLFYMPEIPKKLWKAEAVRIERFIFRGKLISLQLRFTGKMPVLHFKNG